jgi:hypothetical protein
MQSYTKRRLQASMKYSPCFKRGFHGAQAGDLPHDFACAPHSAGARSAELSAAALTKDQSIPHPGKAGVQDT